MSESLESGLEPTRILAVRHGETAWNVDKRLQGQLDVPLNDRGRDQARRAGASLIDEAPDVIYTSDLVRARETAEALAAALQRPLVPEKGLRERDFGRWQGFTYAEIETQWPELSARWRSREPGFGPEGGETLQGFYDRVVTTATGLARRHPGQTIAFVVHGGVLDCLYRAACHMALNAPRTWELPNTGINRLLWTGHSFTLIGWADVQHLTDAAEDEGADRLGHAA
jgi:2,3-bisphosphoglycerate-dependent phosphoglycerate mutase